MGQGKTAWVDIFILFPKISRAAFLWSGERCAYLRVISKLLWPKSSWTVFKSTPAITRWEANVCLKSWNLKSTISALFLAPSKVFLIFPYRSPFLLQKTQGLPGILLHYSPFDSFGKDMLKAGYFSIHSCIAYLSLTSSLIFLHTPNKPSHFDIRNLLLVNPGIERKNA